VHAFRGGAFQLRGVHSEDVDDGALVEVHAVLVAIWARDDALLEAASAGSASTGLTAVAWEVVPQEWIEDDMAPSRFSFLNWRSE
jgi:hypothetical protein